MDVLFVCILLFGFIGLLYMGAIKLDEWTKKREKRLKLDLEKMEAEAEAEMYGSDSANIASAVTSSIEKTQVNGTSIDPKTAAQLAYASVKCVQCGAALEAGSKFCRFCGTKVPEYIQKAEINANVNVAVKHRNEARIREAELKHDLEAKKIELEKHNNRMVVMIFGILAVLIIFIYLMVLR